MLAINYEASAQQADTSFSNRHQLGYNATETIRLFQRESEHVYKLYYRYQLNSSSFLRSGLNYSLDTSGQGSLDIDIKIGFDRVFKTSGKWRFYAGGDFMGGFEKFSSSSRKNYIAGAGPFFGVIFFLNEHFSLSTEPGLFFKVKYYKNTNTFNPENSETWVEMDMVNVGQIIMSVHF